MSQVDYGAWRALFKKEFIFAGGLLVTARKVELLDLASQEGRIPTPLTDEVFHLLQQPKGFVLKPDLSNFPNFAKIVKLVAKVAIIDPPLADTADSEHFTVDEFQFYDLFEIYNWTQQEVAPLVTFSEQPAGSADVADSGEIAESGTISSDGDNE